MKQLRINQYYHSFFNHWTYQLEKKVQHRFLFWKWHKWEKVAGNGLTDYGTVKEWLKEFGPIEIVITSPFD